MTSSLVDIEPVFDFAERANRSSWMIDGTVAVHGPFSVHVDIIDWSRIDAGVSWLRVVGSSSSLAGR